MSTNRQTITQHEGKKYIRTIYPAMSFNADKRPINIDVYCVLKAFHVTCPATAHAIKKLLCAGERGKGSRKEDLIGVLAAINRAIELEEE
jgi:hypothetical protein